MAVDQGKSAASPPSPYELGLLDPAEKITAELLRRAERLAGAMQVQPINAEVVAQVALTLATVYHAVIHKRKD